MVMLIRKEKELWGTFGSLISLYITFLTGIPLNHIIIWRSTIGLYKPFSRSIKSSIYLFHFFRSALRYLGCADLSELAMPDQQSHAFHLCLAALLGKDVYNFGELLAHPILSSLNGTPNAWLVDLLLAFNSGKVQSYENLRSQWTKQPDLNQNQEVLYEKLCLLVLMEMTFRRDANDRQITFNDVSEQTGLNIDKVELLVMKALSKGLVKGHIGKSNF